MKTNATIFHRRDCRLCQSKNLNIVLKLNPIPIAEKYVDSFEEARKLEKFPIDLYLCSDCGHVQLLDVVDSQTLWDDYTYFSGQNVEIINHFNQVAESLVSRYKLPSGSFVVDIGSNDGTLLKAFKRFECAVLGVDPAKEIAEKATASGIPTLPYLVTIDLACEIRKKHGPASLITAFNVFAHADNLGEMIDSIHLMLLPDGLFVFECQYLLDVVDKFLIGTIFHEHMSHHSLTPLSLFLKKHGLELIDVERVAIQNGSIVCTAQLDCGKRKRSESVNALLELEKKCFLSKPETFKILYDKLSKSKFYLNEIIQSCKKNNLIIAGYGAARSSGTFLSQFSLGEIIQYIFDDHPMKVGKFTPSYGIKIIPTKKINELKPDYVVILAANYSEKIIKNNKEYLKSGGKFITLIPELKIIDG